MICCLNPHCLQESPPCPDSTKYCTSCGTRLALLSDRYRPIKRIGQGGFGITYLAEDTARFNKCCVIKQLTLQIPDAQRLFEAEARRLEELADYPSIPRLLAYHSNSNYLYLVQEFVEGQDLNKELQQKGVFNEAQVKDFLNVILPILGVIHERGIIHRDIKLDNIMRSANNRLVLIDFGISKIIPANNTPYPGTIAGTNGYAAPEQMKEGIVTPASDLYSLGAASFHLLTNMSPGNMFMDYGYNWTISWREHLNQSISTELGEIIDKLLRHEYKNRYQSAKEVLKALDEPNPQKILQQPPLNNVATVISSVDRKNNYQQYAALAAFITMIGSGFFVVNNTFQQTAESYFEHGNKRPASDKKGSIEDYTQAIKLKPNYPEAYFNRGVDRFDSGDKKDAIKDYTQAIKLKSDYSEAYYNRAVARSSLNDQKGAIEDYTQAITLNPDYTKAFYGRGLERSESGNQKGAIEDYTQAIKLNPDYVEAYVDRGVSRSSANNKKGAIEDYTKAIKLQPSYSLAYYNRAITRSSLNDRKGAIEDYTEAIKLSPNNPDYYSNRGLVRVDSDDITGAIEDCNQSLKIKSDHPASYICRGMAKYKSNDKKSGIEDIKRGTELFKTQGDEERYKKSLQILKEIGQ
jgi:serine/threonine protein kinase